MALTATMDQLIRLLETYAGVPAKEAVVLREGLDELEPFDTEVALLASSLDAGTLAYAVDTEALHVRKASTWEQVATGLVSDELAKVSANDTTAGFLNGKLVQGAGITLTELGDGTNETLSIAAGVQALIADADNDTKIETERTADDDNIWFKVGGFDLGNWNSTGLAVESDIFVGNGFTDATPSSKTVQGTGGQGTNIAGADLVLGGGVLTGDGSGTAAGRFGTVRIRTAPAGASGSTPGTLTDVLTVDPAALATLTGTLKYVDGNQGAAKVLTSTADGTASWADPAGQAASSSGAVQFSAGGGVFSADASNLFWDNAVKELGIGTATTQAALTVSPTVRSNTFELALDPGSPGNDLSLTRAASGGLSVSVPASALTSIVGYALAVGALTATSGNVRGMHLTSNFSPSSGSAVFSALQLSPVVAQTGGSTGVTRALLISPSIGGGVPDFRAIEVTAGRSVFGGDAVVGTGEGTDAVVVGKTLRAPDLITGGLGNVLGANLTLGGGLGTGTGNPGDVLIDVPVETTAGDNLQSRATIAQFASVGTALALSFFGTTPVVQPTDLVALTDSTTGAANDTVVAISGSGADAAINDNFADVIAKINGLRTRLRDLGLMA